MSRWEFMRRLEELLSDISPSEREEALQYYNDYFNDAGKENEQEVMQALGTPEQVAQTVKEGLGDGSGAGFFTENGFSSNSTTTQNEIVKRTDENNSGSQANQTVESKNTSDKKDMPTWAIVLIIVTCVLFSPAILGFLASAVAFLFSLVVAIFSLVLGLGITAIVLYVVAIGLIIGGFCSIVSSPLAAVALIGAGCVCAGLGILFMLLTVFLAGKCIPAIFQGIGYIFKKIFGKKGGAKA